MELNQWSQKWERWVSWYQTKHARLYSGLQQACEKTFANFQFSAKGTWISAAKSQVLMEECLGQTTVIVCFRMFLGLSLNLLGYKCRTKILLSVISIISVTLFPLLEDDAIRTRGRTYFTSSKNFSTSIVGTWEDLQFTRRENAQTAFMTELNSANASMTLKTIQGHQNWHECFVWMYKIYMVWYRLSTCSFKDKLQRAVCSLVDTCDKHTLFHWDWTRLHNCLFHTWQGSTIFFDWFQIWMGKVQPSSQSESADLLPLCFQISIDKVQPSSHSESAAETYLHSDCFQIWTDKAQPLSQSDSADLLPLHHLPTLGRNGGDQLGGVPLGQVVLIRQVFLLVCCNIGHSTLTALVYSVRLGPICMRSK